MNEFTLYVLNEDLKPVMSGLQQFGEVSFKNLSAPADTAFLKPTIDYDFESNRNQQEHIQAVLKSIEKYEKTQTKKKKRLTDNMSVLSMSYENLETRAQHIDIDQILSVYDENYDESTTHIEGIEISKPWGRMRIDVETLIAFQSIRPITGTIPLNKKASLLKGLERFHYYVSVMKEVDQEVYLSLWVLPDDFDACEVTLRKASFEQRSAKALGLVEASAMTMESLAQFIEKRSTMFERYQHIGVLKEELMIYYEFLKNEELAYHMRENFLQSEQITVIGGWVESGRIDEFSELVKQLTHDIHHFTTRPAPLDDREVPVKLRNNAFVAVFETITGMYSQPRYNELDPTPLLTPFYALFFGMMLADVGYGLLMGMVMFAVLKMVTLKSTTERFVRFLFVLAFPTIFWGLIYGSFFGGLIEMKGLIDINRDFNMVLVMSLMLGIVHLFTGLAIKGYLLIRDSKKRYVIYDVVLWMITILTAAINVSVMFTPLLANIAQPALIIMFIAMIGIVFTNGREAKTIVGKFFSGLYSLYGITNYVGDIVSYSRLMALGLAGASIGMAFNMIVDMLSANGPIGVIAAFMIFLIGHGFNVFISGLSAYVHSARLTYVEFFGKFYTGGGKPFVAFRAKPTYIEIQ